MRAITFYIIIFVMSFITGAFVGYMVADFLMLSDVGIQPPVVIGDNTYFRF